MEAGSTTWLSIPSFCRTRWLQNPSSPASWMTMIGKTCPVRARAFSLSWDKRARRAAMSPLRSACLDIFSPPPGAREVMTQVERLSSRDTKIALRSVRIAACSSGRGQRACMVAPKWVVQHPHSARERGATNRAHGIFIDAYTRVHGRPPAEPAMQRHFGVSPPSVHQMVLTLERLVLVRRQPGVARSIEVLLAPEDLPVLRHPEPIKSSVPRN